jgi:hypothetical protein
VWAVCKGGGKYEYYVGYAGKWWKIIDPNRPHPSVKAVTWRDHKGIKLPMGVSFEPDNRTLDGFTQEEITRVLGPAPMSCGESLIVGGAVLTFIGGMLIAAGPVGWMVIAGMVCVPAGAGLALIGAIVESSPQEGEQKKHHPKIEEQRR